MTRRHPAIPLSYPHNAPASPVNGTRPQHAPHSDGTRNQYDQQPVTVRHLNQASIGNRSDAIDDLSNSV